MDTFVGISYDNKHGKCYYCNAADGGDTFEPLDDGDYDTFKFIDVDPRAEFE